MASGIEASCGCRKFVLCPFPTTTWYYATLCYHDNDSAPRTLTPTTERAHWWYDFNRQHMISVVTFGQKYDEVLAQQTDPGAFAVGLLATYVCLHVGERFFHVSRDGQVRNVYPGSIDGRWL